jgi:mannose-6-phosphate isomerase-like protein (cupin superfamily)
MSDLEHIRDQFPSLELARADVQRDGFYPVEYEHPNAETFETHCHPIEETVYLLRGSMTFTVAGKSYPLRIGDKLRLPALTPHSVVVADNTMYLMGWSREIPWSEFRVACPPDPDPA